MQFQEEFRLVSNKFRSRKFTPENLFKTMVYHCSGKNKEGYLLALIQSFELNVLPVKSSLSKYRNKISFLFFKEVFFDLLNSFSRPKWRGLQLYATDGFEMTLPRRMDITEGGYKGLRLSTDSGANTRKRPDSLNLATWHGRTAKMG